MRKCGPLAAKKRLLGNLKHLVHTAHGLKMPWPHGGNGNTLPQGTQIWQWNSSIAMARIKGLGNHFSPALVINHPIIGLRNFEPYPYRHLYSSISSISTGTLVCMT